MPDSSVQPGTDAPAADTLALRAALGQFATGVCIVAAPPVAGEAHPFAITVNSFASVSLHPPMVLWSIQKASTTYDLWLQTRQFGISVLSNAQRDVCERYAMRGSHAMTDEAAYRLSPNGSPLIPASVATFDCRLNAIHDAGDHKILVADVLFFEHDASRDPLIYLRGGFHGPA